MDSGKTESSDVKRVRTTLKPMSVPEMKKEIISLQTRDNITASIPASEEPEVLSVLKGKDQRAVENLPVTSEAKPENPVHERTKYQDFLNPCTLFFTSTCSIGSEGHSKKSYPSILFQHAAFS